jgi:hypothetical protein
MPPYRDLEESARWLLTSGVEPGTVRMRICECDTLEEVYTWVRVYNEVQDQLPPGRKDLVEAMARHADRIRAENAPDESGDAVLADGGEGAA